MPVGNPNFVPGHKPNGHRPLGSRNRRTTDAINLIIKAGHQDPLLTLAELQANSSDEGIRATAANMLAPFLHSKCGATPPLRFLEEPFELPHPNPTTEAEISANIGYLAQALAAGTLDIDFYNALLIGQHQHINALKAREELPENQNILITGGLPSLPGCNITMPTLATMRGFPSAHKRTGSFRRTGSDRSIRADGPHSDVVLQRRCRCHPRETSK